MKNPKVSIIMPIYNPGVYLLQSLGGILKQTLSEIEIICVNDGSTDNSLELIKEYAKKDARIHVIDKQNGGYGHSMNKGLQVAKGEYIGILEPDDFVDDNMFEYLYLSAKKYDADVVKSNYYEYEDKRKKNTFFEVLKGFQYNKIMSAYTNERIIHMRPCIWSAIYRRDMLLQNHVLFNETPGASYQDTAFAFKVWVSAKRVVFLQNAFLHYRIDNSNSSVNSSGKIFSICDEFNAIQAYLNENLEKRNKFSKILQVLKLDSYTWNLGRISKEYKEIFRDQIALDFIKADYEGFLDKAYFDQGRWKNLQAYINEYKESHLSQTNGRTLIKAALKKFKKKYL